MDHRICPPHLKGIRSDYVMNFFKKYYKVFPPDPNVLDLGSGRWRHAKLSRFLGIKNITCIDKSSYQDQPGKVYFLKHDLEKGIPLRKETFDIILCCYVMMFIVNRDLLMDEINRVSKPGAFLLIEVNEKKLKQGFPIDADEIISFFRNLNWNVLHIRKRPVGRSIIFQNVSDKGRLPWPEEERVPM